MDIYEYLDATEKITVSLQSPHQNWTTEVPANSDNTTMSVSLATVG